jgi:leucyl aminopeptidase (aminopeptidase T)
MKTKWNSPGGIIYKFHWYPQSHIESRPPLSRVAFTSTVPIDKLIDSTLIDYKKMRKRNAQIAEQMDKSEKVIVKSNIKNGCDFEVGLRKKNGERRQVLGSDSDVRTILHPMWLKKNKKMGRMANIPGGEAFTTPEYVKGKIVGDVVINIDRSWSLSKKEPFVAEATKKGYKIISGPKDVIKAFNKRKKDAWKNILEQEKNNSLSKEIIKLKKKNFEHIGEFAINTNPHASLCDYLIINEKIANMIHVAFGSGFEADTATEYHMDVVIDSPRQKLDIYGIDKKNNKNWIIKNGRFVL